MSKGPCTENGNVCGGIDVEGRGDGNYTGIHPNIVANDSATSIDENTIILEDKFSLFPKKRALYKVTVTHQSLTAESAANGDNISNSNRRRSLSSITLPLCIDFKDVIGCHVMRGKTADDKSAYFCVYHYPWKRKMLAKKLFRRRHATTFVIDKAVTYEENMVIAEHWKRVIVCLARGLSVQDLSSLEIPPTKKYLIFVNPFSGTRKALKLFKEQIVSILCEAEVDYDLVVTERPNHARDLMTTLDLDRYRGIVIVSGDGLIYEVLNGLMMRKDWEKAIKIPIGALPGGTGNALCCSINHTAGAPYLENALLHSTYILIKHQVIPMDLVAVDTLKRRLYSFLSISWGIMADVDIESEKYRRLGSVRFTIGGLTRIFNLRTYRGRLSFLPLEPYVPRRARSKSTTIPPRRSASMYEPDMQEHSKERRAMSTSETFSTFDQARKMTHSESIAEASINAALEEQLMDIDARQQVEDINCNAALKSCGVDDDVILESPPRDVLTPLLPPIHQEPPSNWVTIDDDFVMVIASYQTHLGKEAYMLPHCKFDDGCIHLCFIRKGASRGALLGMMSALENGTHLDSPFFETVRVSAFRLEPITLGGIIAVDGEVVDYGTIQAQVMPSAARIMALSSRD